MKTPLNIFEKIQGFANLLEDVIPEKITSNSYAQRYLRYLLEKKYYFLQIYATVLQKGLALKAKPIDQCALVDFGAGHGLLGLFASYCGFNKVLLHERDASFLQAARSLRNVLSVGTCYFVEGDETAFAAYPNDLHADFIVSADVIEHVYNLDGLLELFKQHCPHACMVHMTAANASNPMIEHRLKKLQIKDECLGSDPSSGERTYDQDHLSFIEIRKQLIRTCFPDCSDDLLHTLALRTRGLRKDDLMSAVENYFIHGILPAPPQHPTNTCHPITGSWTERLLTFQEYSHLLGKYNYILKIEKGFYDAFTQRPSRFLFKTINHLIVPLGICFSPFILLISEKIND